MAKNMDSARKAAVAARRQSPDEFAEGLRPMVEQARARGAQSYHALADYFTERGIKTAGGHEIWDHVSARRLLARLKKLDADAIDQR
jgi:hypothetical protein